MNMSLLTPTIHQRRSQSTLLQRLLIYHLNNLGPHYKCYLGSPSANAQKLSKGKQVQGLSGNKVLQQACLGSIVSAMPMRTPAA